MTKNYLNLQNDINHKAPSITRREEKVLSVSNIKQSDSRGKVHK